ncbi:hypothetical protein AN960_23475 [Bacillus sp. FJAT-25509]|uniref:hypothetical protein n=1 Tax=Bacillaceae TaxID=186817 RepID=UPI0006FCB377|nr:hypothetical protein [Bacillus sp. FJAT-25509]KQL32927.1 hypothetical protein AN960_23475 [Bacillus sp. FJAT-25509]
MKNKYTVLFLLLFIASITGGLALKNVLEFSMIYGVGLGLIFLACSIYFVIKSEKKIGVR